MICVIKIMYWSLCCLQVSVLACASCQILKTAGFACAGNAGNVLPPPGVSDPDMHHGTCVTHVPWCMPGSLTSGLLWRQWRGKLSHHSRRMLNPKFYVSGKRSISWGWLERKWESLVYKYSLLMHCIKIKSPANFLLNERYVLVGENISFLYVLSCSSEEA